MSVLTRHEVAEAILTLSAKKSGQRLAEDVAAYLVANRRTSELDAIMREVARLRTQRDGVAEVTATSAYALNDAARTSIKKLLHADKLTINEVIDTEVLGGVRLETSEELLDLTVRNRLNQLKMAGR
jgi:F-type H+-transporting ATPase subunit delta